MSARRVVTAVVSCSLLLVGCGGRVVAGTYNCPEGSALVLKEDGTFTAVGHDAAFRGTYEVDGDTITVTPEQGTSASATIREDGSLLFAGEDEACVRR